MSIGSMPTQEQDNEVALSPRPVILVVEDEALIAIMLGEILADAGYDAVLAHSGEEALLLAKSMERLSAVVTDIHLMRGIDGRSVMRELRKVNSTLPVVVVTGFGQWAPEADLRGLGGPTARLVKPFSGDQLIASLAGVLASTNGRAPRSNDRERAASLNWTANNS